jgi:phospholipid/cholesterol/gamma-HCH transport system substrate-binding protein
MQNNNLDFSVGIFVLLGLLSLLFMAVKVAHLSDFTNYNNDSYSLYANFANIGSLKIDAPVKISGFVVGRVSNISLDKLTYQAVVTLQIDNRYKVTDDTSAEILTTGLLGEQYIGLQAGSSSSFFKSGDTISITSSAMVLENLISKFMTNISK